MGQNQIDILKRALNREKAARKQAEKILEKKSTELYFSNKKLENLNLELESLVKTKDSQLQGVFENIVDPYVIITLKGNVLKMNDAALHLLGYENDSLDCNLLELIHPSEYEKGAIAYDQILYEGSITNFEINITTKQNVNKTVHINASVIYDNGTPTAIQGIVRDITILKHQELVQQTINKITQSILGKDDLYVIAETITNIIVDYLKTEDCDIYLYNENDKILEQIAAYGKKLDENDELINKLVLIEGQGICGSVAKHGKAEIVNNTTLDKRYVADNVVRKSEITVPIKIGEQLIGIIDSEHELENYFNEEHLYFLELVANIIAVKLKSAQELKKRKNVEAKLIESESRMSTLILNLDTGVLLEDENSNIILTNKQFCNIFEIPLAPEQLIGMDCSTCAEQHKHLFQDPEMFLNTINKNIEKKHLVLGELLTMVNGKSYERDFIPIFRDNEYKGHLWSYKDVTYKRNYRNSLEAQRKKYRDIIANMNLGLIEVDKNDVILMTNHSFLEMSGYTDEELIGHKANEIFTTGNASQKILDENKKRNKGISNSYQLSVKNKLGEDRYWLISGAPNYDINGNVIGSIGIHLDITDLKILQTQKERLLYELEKSNQYLQEYAHIVSHDLKSPLNNIYALVSWLKEDNKDKLDQTSLENIGHIEYSLEKMEHLINSVLEYSKVGVKLVKNEHIDLNELVAEILSILFIPKHISINIKNKLPVIKGDSVKIQQVFQNILTNAIKYNDKEKGLIEIDVKKQKHEYEFSIKDNGMGIDNQYHDKIFKIFNKLSSSKDSTGIGLSIVKKIVNLYGGDIWIESEPGLGTTFFFTLKK